MLPLNMYKLGGLYKMGCGDGLLVMVPLGLMVVVISDDAALIG
jgi:hypothetical protein